MKDVLTALKTQRILVDKLFQHHPCIVNVLRLFYFCFADLKAALLLLWQLNQVVLRPRIQRRHKESLILLK